ncbi:MAG TPA: GNAT family protein [Acidimicrobiia bacterium]|nr:GNAT family protein [Acidimicrobiia bacterium]
MLKPDYPIRTERLRLRPYLASDLDFLCDVMSRPEVVRFLYHDVRPRQEVADLLEKRTSMTSIRAEGDNLVLAVQLGTTGPLVGDVTLSYQSATHRQGEIGWVFHPDHHGHGYATEASRVLLRLAFEGLDLHRVIARCDGRNRASFQVMERLGMRREAHFVENEFVKGEWTDEVVCALLAAEWRARPGESNIGASKV